MKDVYTQLNEKYIVDQQWARRALLKIVSTLKLLAGEGIALHGKEYRGGNFKKLLELRTKDDDNFSSWLYRKTNYTSHDIANELLSLMSSEILRRIVKLVLLQSRYSLVSFLMVLRMFQAKSRRLSA